MIFIARAPDASLRDFFDSHKFQLPKLRICKLRLPGFFLRKVCKDW